MPSGFLLINKPMDWTSHDVVGYLRGVTKIRKIGHAGTLDPFATGLLIVGVERESTKRLDEFKEMTKQYTAEIQLGATSNTQDRTGTITQTKLNPEDLVTKERITEVINTFIGEQQQIPPMFSAKKIKGQKLYELARKGIEIERQPNTITIHDIKFMSFDETKQSFIIKITCSTGTYIRTIAHDIGQALGTDAYCTELHRNAIGPYTSDKKPNPKDLTKENWESHLLDIPKTKK